MEQEPAPRRQGRPRKDPARQKKNRTLSFTNAEYEELVRQATAANRGVSEFVIEQLALNKPAPPSPQ
jgi:hypothetical protein